MQKSCRWFFFHFVVCTGRECMAGWQVRDRERKDSGGGNGWTMVSPDQQFQCNGQVTEWRYQSKQSSAFQAIVWRPTVDSDIQFQIVGINDIPAGAVNTPVRYIVPQNDRITVKAGDVIGWSFRYSALTFDYGGDYRVRWLNNNQLDNLRVNQMINITGGVATRDYSIAATVNELGKQLIYYHVNLTQCCKSLNTRICRRVEFLMYNNTFTVLKQNIFL